MAVDPLLGCAHAGLGDTLYLLEYFDEAEAAYREAIRLDPADARMHNGLGKALRGMERHREAEAANLEASASTPLTRTATEDSASPCMCWGGMARP